jgi:hypothetical protein
MKVITYNIIYFLINLAKITRQITRQLYRIFYKIKLIIQKKSSNNEVQEKVARNSHGFPTFYR